MQSNKIWRDPFFWLAFLIGGLFLSLTLWYGAGLAQAFIAYISWVWKEYHLPPFVGAFNHNFPGIYIMGRLAMELFGDSVLALRIMDLIIQLSCLPMVFYVAKRVSGLSIAGFFASVFYGIYYYGLSQNNTLHRDPMVFSGLIFCVAFAFVLENRLWLRAFLVGVMLGYVFLLKPQYGLAWPVFGMLFLIQGIMKRRKATVLELVLFSFSCILPTLLIVFYYWRLGGDALDKLYFANITFNFKVYNAMVDPHIQRLVFWHESLPNIIFKLYPLVFFSAVFLIILLLLNIISAKDRPLFLLLLVMTLVCLINYWSQGKYFLYHSVPFVAFLIIFSGWALGMAADWIKNKTRPAWAGIFVSAFCLAMIILMISTSVSPGLRRFAKQYCFRSFEKAYMSKRGKTDEEPRLRNNYMVANYFRPLLKEDDQIVCFGPYALIPFLLKKKMPTYVPFVQHMLFKRGDGKILPEQEQMIREYSSQVINARPRFFIFANTLTARGNETFNLINEDAWSALEQLFPELYQFLGQNYKLRETIGEVYIYEIQPAAESH